MKDREHKLQMAGRRVYKKDPENSRTQEPFTCRYESLTKEKEREKTI